MRRRLMPSQPLWAGASSWGALGPEFIRLMPEAAVPIGPVKQMGRSGRRLAWAPRGTAGPHFLGTNTGTSTRWTRRQANGYGKFGWMNTHLRRSQALLRLSEASFTYQCHPWRKWRERMRKMNAANSGA